jgi:hypothetical protein
LLFKFTTTLSLECDRRIGMCVWVGGCHIVAALRLRLKFRISCGSCSYSYSVGCGGLAHRHGRLIGTVGLTIFERDTRLASPPLACLRKSVAAWIFYWRLLAVGHGDPLGPLQLHGWEDDGLSFSMRYCGSECSWVLLTYCAHLFCHIRQTMQL